MKRNLSALSIPSQNTPRHLKNGTYVRVTKIHATVGGFPPCPKPIYAPGLWTGILSLPVDYWMEGFLMADVVKNGLIRLERRVRDGTIADGFFTSTRIYSVKDDKVRTFNSIYRIETVEPFIPGLSN
jgi:hypothetical protein